jgi:hypothetical protein
MQSTSYVISPTSVSRCVQETTTTPTISKRTTAAANELVSVILIRSEDFKERAQSNTRSSSQLKKSWVNYDQTEKLFSHNDRYKSYSNLKGLSISRRDRTCKSTGMTRPKTSVTKSTATQRGKIKNYIIKPGGFISPPNKDSALGS